MMIPLGIKKTNSVKINLRSVRYFSISCVPYRNFNKVYNNVYETINDIKSGNVILSGGFGLCGVPNTLIKAINENKNIKGLTLVSNNPGVGDKGLGMMVENEGKISKFICSYLGNNKKLSENYFKGKIEVELTPQGNIAERLSAAARGIPAFYTPTGYGTAIENGELVTKYDENANPLQWSPKHEVRQFDNRNYILVHALKGNFAIIKAHKVDELGNVQFNHSAHNFNGVMAKAADTTIVEAEHIVKAGEIENKNIHLPGIYVDRICQSNNEKHIEVLKLRQDNDSNDSNDNGVRDKIAARAAMELKNGYYCNLGVGMPTLIPEYLPKDINVHFQSENGVIGVGPYPTKEQVDPDIINAGKETITLNAGASTFGSEESFGMIRSGQVDVSILGAFQVSSKGDLANYMIPNKLMKGMGGAMDLVSNPLKTKVIIVMEHCDKYGNSKIVDRCSLPLTGMECISKIITDLAVFEVQNRELVLTDIADTITLDELKSKTLAIFRLSDDLKTF